MLRFKLRTLCFFSEFLIHPLRCRHLGIVDLFYFTDCSEVCMEIKLDTVDDLCPAGKLTTVEIDYS